MAKLFVSHSSEDNVAAVAIAGWLRDNGWDDIFLDFDPRRGIKGGERWEQALNEAASRCEAVLLLVSRGWLASEWCLREFNLADKLNKRLLGVLIDEIPVAELPVYLTGTWQLVDLAVGKPREHFNVTVPVTGESADVSFSSEGLLRLREGLRKAGLDPSFFSWPPHSDPMRSPYPGLRSLEAEDAGIFFGREPQIIEALDRMRAVREGTIFPMLCVIGASGSGKSSFMRAGVWPRLKRDDRNFLPLPVLRPALAALTGRTGFAAVLAAALAEVEAPLSRDSIDLAVRMGATAVAPLFRRLVEAASRRLGDNNTTKPPLLVLPIDQGEELFLGDGATEGGALLVLLRDLLSAADHELAVLLTIRSDAIERLQIAPTMEGLPFSTITFSPMPRGLFASLIERPAARLADTDHPLVVEPALVRALLDDMEAGGGRDALPLLAFTLERIWLQYGHTGYLNQRDYEALGGVRGSIEAAVARAIAAADADPRIPADHNARLMLLRRGLIPWLAGIDPDTGSPRRRVARHSEIPKEARPLVDLLVEQRLLSSDIDVKTGEATIEPAHEALLRQWGLLDGWLAEDFGLLAILEGVKRASREWTANARQDAWLAHQGGRLSDTQGLDARADIAIGLEPTDLAYLSACRLKEQAELEALQQRRREREAEQARRLADARKIARRTGLGLVAALVLAIAAAGFGIVAKRQKGLADQKTAEAKRNLSAVLVALSKNTLEQSPLRATKLALASLPRNQLGVDAPKNDDALRALSEAALQLLERKTLTHPAQVQLVAFSPDSKRLLTAADDHKARLWDVATGELIATLVGHPRAITSLNFSSDGNRIATSSQDGAVHLWDGHNGDQIAAFTEHDQTVNLVKFSSDGGLLASASDDGTVILHDTKTKEISNILSHGTERVSHISFSADSKHMLTASTAAIRLWNTGSGETLPTLLKQGNFKIASFSPNGQSILGVSDRAVQILGIPTGSLLQTLNKHEMAVETAEFSPDGSQILTASLDHTAMLWDVQTGDAILRYRHASGVYGAHFTPDGKRAITASFDGTAKLWDTTVGKQIIRFSDGSTMDARKTEKMMLYVKEAMPAAVFRGHRNAVHATAVSSDERTVATASWDGTVKLWNMPAVRPMMLFWGHQGFVAQAKLSPDGRHLLTASSDGTARVWDTNTGELKRTLRHQKGVEDARYSQNGAFIVTGSADNTVRIWNAENKAVVLRGHKSIVSSVSFSPDGSKVLSSSLDGTIRIWDVATERTIKVYSQADVLSSEFSPDGRLILTTSNGRAARILDSSDGKTVADLGGTADRARSAGYSYDGKLIATGGGDEDKAVRIWKPDGRLIAVLRGHTGSVSGVSFSRDGKRLASAGMEIIIWDLSTFQPIASSPDPSGGTFASISFTLNSKRIVTSSSEATARTWDISSLASDNLLELACNRLPDWDLTNIGLSDGAGITDPICRPPPLAARLE